MKEESSFEELHPNHATFGWWICYIPIASIMWMTIGYTFSSMWLWFVVPLGVKPVNGFHAAGLYLMFSVMFGRLDAGRDQKDRALIATAIAKTLFFLIILTVAYFLKGAI